MDTQVVESPDEEQLVFPWHEGKAAREAEQHEGQDPEPATPVAMTAEEVQQELLSAALAKMDPVEVLVLKLEAFLSQQPEWALILTRPRNERRRAVTLLAKRFLTIPVRGGVRRDGHARVEHQPPPVHGAP